MQLSLTLILTMALSLLSAAELPLDNCTELTNWKLDPHPAEQTHSLTATGNSLLYQSAGKGKHSYSQFIRRNLKSVLSSQPRFDTMSFELKGDGSSAPMQVIVFCTDGSRWQHPVSTGNPEWQNISLKFREFKPEPHGKRSASITWPDSRMIEQISFWFDKRSPHQIELKNLGVDSPDYNAPKLMAKMPLVQFYPATTHRNNRTYLLPGQVTPLSIFFGRMEGVESPVLQLKMPKTMKYVAATVGDNTQAEILKAPPVECSPGIWEIALPDQVCAPAGISKFQKNLNCFVTTTPQAVPGQDTLEWALLSHQKVIAAGMIHVETLPPLAALPKGNSRIHRYLYTTILFAAPQKDLRDALARLFESAGIRGGVIYPKNRQASLDLIARGWKLYQHAFNWWDNWGCYLGDLSAPAAEIRVTLADGKPAKNPGAICPEWLLEHSSPDSEYYQKAKARLANYVIPGMAGFLNDHEMLWSSELSPANGCFDSRCLRKFAVRYGLDEKELTPEIILRDLRDKWYDFRFAQQGELIGIYGKIVKSFDPSFHAAICSFVVTSSRYEVPINIASYDGKIDEHWPMCYKSGVSFHSELENTMKGVRTPVTVLLNNCDPIGERVYIPPKEFELNLLSALTSGVRGVGIFTGDISLDGEYLSILNRTELFTRPLEQYVLDGSRADHLFQVHGVPDQTKERELFGQKLIYQIPNWAPSLRFRAFELGGEYLVCAFNYSSQGPGFLQAAFPAAQSNYYVYNLGNQVRLDSPSGQKQWTVDELKRGVPGIFQSWGSCFLLLSPTLREDVPSVTPQQIREQYEQSPKSSALGNVRTITISDREKRIYPLNPVSAISKMTETGKVDLSCDKDNLYVDFTLSDRSIQPGRNGNDVEIWATDCVEVFLTDGASSYYHFGVNPAGGKYDAKDQNSAWNGKWDVAVSGMPDGWRATFTIPWQTLNPQGPIQGNFARENMPSGELSSVIPNGGDFHSRKGFGELVILSNSGMEK